MIKKEEKHTKTSKRKVPVKQKTYGVLFDERNEQRRRNVPGDILGDWVFEGFGGRFLEFYHKRKKGF